MPLRDGLILVMLISAASVTRYATYFTSTLIRENFPSVGELPSSEIESFSLS